MLPQRYANHYLSLLPKQKRPTLSVLFLMDDEARVLQPPPKLLQRAKMTANFRGSYQIAATLICSQHRLTYAQAESYVHRSGTISALNEACSTLFKLSEHLKRKRYLNGHLMLDESKNLSDYKSHSLIEQFMILANSVVGGYLVENSHVSINRTQNAPDLLKLNAWCSINRPLASISYAVQKYTHCSQRYLSPLDDSAVRDSSPPAQHLSTSAANYMNLKSACEQGDFDKLAFLIKSEMNYPACAVAIGAMKGLAKPARYLRPVCDHEADNYLRHFDLNIENYTHFTSPIRRYVDLVAHRLVKSTLSSGSGGSYSSKDLDSICMTSNLRMYNSRRFDETLGSIRLAEMLREAPLKCLAFVSVISDTFIKLTYPFMKSRNQGLNQVKYSMLSLSSQPKLSGYSAQVDEEAEERCKCCLFWSLQVFDADKDDQQVWLTAFVLIIWRIFKSGLGIC